MEWNIKIQITHLQCVIQGIAVPGKLHQIACKPEGKK